jgi:hypothetical protein
MRIHTRKIRFITHFVILIHHTPKLGCAENSGDMMIFPFLEANSTINIQSRKLITNVCNSTSCKYLSFLIVFFWSGL